MDPDTVIKVDHLYKKFCKSLKRSLAYGTLDLTRNFLGLPANSGRLRKAEFWALDDIYFELKKGEALGIIGVNGSGKSTLLRLLTGIFPPDKGSISIRGKIGSLIAVGAGFHPHMSGRENIYLNATILGMRKDEIDTKFNSIVDFADIGDFLEAPVSTYSSGMRVRLGFAIAIHCEPDILLIDEILSVGDLSFKNKSLRYMSEFRKRANALIFVSHDLEQIRNICNKLIVMDKGKVVYQGEPAEGIILYQNMSKEVRLESLELENKKRVFGKVDEDEVKYIDSGILNENGRVVKEIGEDDSFTHYVDFEMLSDQDELIFSSGVFDEKNTSLIWVISSDNDRYHFKNIKKGKYRIKFHYKHHHLMPGVYTITHGIRNPKTFETFQKITDGGSFIIKSGKLAERAIIRTEYTIGLEVRSHKLDV